MKSTGVIDIVGSSPMPKPCCGEVYGHDAECEAFRAGFAAGLRRAIAAVEVATPFPFKANQGDKDDMEGPFAFYGFGDADDATIEKVERIVGHYLLNVRGAFTDAVGREIVRRGEKVPGWTS